MEEPRIVVATGDDLPGGELALTRAELAEVAQAQEELRKARAMALVNRSTNIGDIAWLMNPPTIKPDI